MATSDQLRALRAASGEQMDVLFLQLMLRHHEGGVIMLQYASEHASVTEVRNLAAQMLSSQTERERVPEAAPGRPRRNPAAAVVRAAATGSSLGGLPAPHAARAAAHPASAVTPGGGAPRRGHRSPSHTDRAVTQRLVPSHLLGGV